MDITLQQLKKKEAEVRKELEDIAGAIRVIERLGSKDGTETSLIDPNVADLGETGTINLDDLNIPKKAKNRRATLLDDAKTVIDRFDSQEFTVNQLFAALLQTGKGKDSKNFRNRVSMIVRRLTGDGFLKRTYKGKGNDPHQYKRSSGKVSLVSSSSN